MNTRMMFAREDVGAAMRCFARGRKGHAQCDALW